MMKSKIMKTGISYSALTGELKGNSVRVIERKLSDVRQIFIDQKAVETMDLNQVVYKVQSYHPVEEGKSGGLFWGTSYLMPGKVGNEYFMTKGHFHSNIDTAEYYWCISGEGMLILMDIKGKCIAEKMGIGSIHYIPGKTAHRIANTGKEQLVVGACWPSDAGHDYNSIMEKGFTYRLLDVNGMPTLKES